MRSLFALLTILLLSANVTACGGASKVANSVSPGSLNAATIEGNSTSIAPDASPTRRYFEGDDDVDDRNRPQKDPDDQSIRGYGNAADVADDRVITALVKHYYAAAATEDGATACSFIYSGFTKGSAVLKALPTDYIPAPRSSVFLGKSCAQVAVLLFKLNHQQLAKDTTGMRVSAVRISGANGLALLGFATKPERWLPVKHESGAWKIAAFLDSEIP